jgi:putative FmdB family regulatory protein
MPVYVYECEKCGRIFNVIQNINDKSLEKHSDCTEGHKDLKEVCEGKIKRIIQSVNLSFKGKGWTPKFFRK